MQDKLNPLQVKTSEKVAKLMTQVKLLWPKYDPDLNATVDGLPLIKKYLAHCFKDATLMKDYEFILKNKDVDDIIMDELEK